MKGSASFFTFPMPPRARSNSSRGDEGRVCHSGERPSLQWLIHPVSAEVFFREYWERRPLVVKRDLPNYFHSLLPLDEIDRVLTTLDLRYPDVTVKNADRKITADDYTIRGDSLDVAKVYQLFAEGSTITLSFLDTVVPTLASFCRSFESEFSFPFQSQRIQTPLRYPRRIRAAGCQFQEMDNLRNSG